MNKLTISIVLPFPVTKPVGGAKIMYEYANRLAEKGHTVSIFHSIERPFKKSKTPIWLKQIIYRIRKVARPKWFQLHLSVKSYIVTSITDRYMPTADIVFSTWWQMAFAISKLSPEKGKPVNLIQDFEVWSGQKENVLASYKLPISHAVIANYLNDLLKENEASNIVYFPNAIDNTKFFISKPVNERIAQSIIMLYSEEERKGTKYGLQAIEELKNEFPDLQVTLFGVYPNPNNLPQWITYYRKPNNLPELFNQHAIFLSPSLGEGWALPPAEAMACGCAVVCTSIGGHEDYAIDGKTAFLIQPENVNDTAEKLRTVLQNNERRIEMAKNGNKYLIENFNWEKSIQIAENYFYSLL